MGMSGLRIIHVYNGTNVTFITEFCRKTLQPLRCIALETLFGLKMLQIKTAIV